MSMWSELLDLLYPPRCAFCHRLLRESGATVCRDCLKSLPYTGTQAERGKLAHIERCLAPLYYENKVRASLHRFKFRQLTGYAGIYSEFMVKCIDENQISCDIITWAPVSRKRLRKRGYDQARLLAEAIAAQVGLPCLPLLEKIRDTEPQSLQKDDARRKKNAKGAYRCSAPEQAQGKRILLIDDIVTSGATLKECARVLRSAGAGPIVALTLARKRG